MVFICNLVVPEPSPLISMVSRGQEAYDSSLMYYQKLSSSLTLGHNACVIHLASSMLSANIIRRVSAVQKHI